jgi:hypothetical protein
MKTGVGVFLSIPFLVLSFESCSTSANSPEPTVDVQFVEVDLQSGYADELNTFTQTYQKDLVADGTITVPFWLTSSEQQAILQKARDVGFFALPDTIHRKGGMSYFISPDPSPDMLRLKYDNLDKTVVWFYPLDTNAVGSKSILEVSNFITQVIQAKPEYKVLPPARGFRL